MSPRWLATFALACTAVPYGLAAQPPSTPPGSTGSAAPAAPAAAAEEGAFELPTAAPAQVIGAPRGRPLAGGALEARTDEVAALLRCPVCQGLSVADSRTGTAVAMKAIARDMLAAGYDQEQVLAYFERSYGGFVRLEPPLRGINWMVWLAPLAGLALGGVVVWRALRAPAKAGRSTQAEAAATKSEPAAKLEAPARDALPADAGLADYVKRVRALAYGWPGGEPPGAS